MCYPQVVTEIVTFNKQVGTNGYFSFDEAFTDYSSFEFPGVGLNTLVAPMFCDIDISNERGRIRYEVHTQRSSPSLISQVNLLINDYMNTEFPGTWMLIAEWKDAPQFGYPIYIVSFSQNIKVALFMLLTFFTD